jgi:hypothetical protein
VADDLELDPGLRLGVAAALSRKYAADQRDFLDLLGQMLETALSEETRVERGGGLFARKTVRRVIVELGEHRYQLEAGKGALTASRTRLVRGIALKTEPIAVEQWLEELGEALDERVRVNAAARTALARLVG